MELEIAWFTASSDRFTSLLAGVSSGIEPVYEFEFIRRDRLGEQFFDIRCMRLGLKISKKHTDANRPKKNVHKNLFLQMI